MTTKIKLQPGYHCYHCPCYDGLYHFCNVSQLYVKRDYTDSLTPAMPLFECPVDHITLTEAGADDLRRPQIMGIFDEHEYTQWLDQRGDGD
jgi:hypothetical protein